MATTVYTTEEIQLQDGSSATLKPLNIKTLRRFMKTMENFQNAESEEEGLEIMLDASALCLITEHPKFWNESENKHSEAFEDCVDMPTIYKILDVCGGLKLNDPNLLAVAQEVLGKS